MKRNIPALVACVLALAGAIICGVCLQWDGLVMTVTPDKLLGLLSPIVFAAAVVERGVEILISPWRDADANKLERDLAAAKVRTAALPADAGKIAEQQKALDDYRGTTQRYAFAISLMLSVFVSISGLRALAPFVDSVAWHAVGPGQHAFFLCVDVALSATLLAGGAVGVHSIVNAITSFFDASADKSSHPAPPA